MVGAVGEMASMKRRKLRKTGEDGLCCSSSATQTQLGPSSLLEERSEIPIVFCCFFVLSATPQTGRNGQSTVYRYIYLLINLFIYLFIIFFFLQVCPERIDLIHKNYRKLCNLLVDVEEWGQVVIINMLTRYARTQFVDPNVGVSQWFATFFFLSPDPPIFLRCPCAP